MGLVAQKQRNTVALAGQELEAIGEDEIAVEIAGDFHALGQFLAERQGRGALGAEGLVHAGGEQAAFEAGGAEHGLLGDGHALEGEQFLGVDGLVAGDEVGAEVSDFLDVFEADDGEAGGGEAMLAGILGGAGLACRRSWSGRTGGIARLAASCFSEMGMRISFRPRGSMPTGWSLKSGAARDWKQGDYFGKVA